MPKLDMRILEYNRIAKEYGLEAFEVGRRHSREALITQARQFLSSCRIDEHKCAGGISGLYEFDASKRKTHSSSTRATDITEAFCYMAIDAKTGKQQDFILRNTELHGRVISDYNALEFNLETNGSNKKRLYRI